MSATREYCGENMFQIKMISCLIGILLLIGCGAGNQTVEVPDEMPIGNITGIVSDASFRESKITVYTLDTSDKRQYVTETRLDEQGRFTIDLQEPPQGLMLELSGGSYIEPSSEIQVNLAEGQVITSPFFYKLGENHIVTISPFTHLATASALSKINQGQPVDNALASTLDDISSFYGLDISKTQMLLNAANQENITEISDNLRYGLLAAGLSQLTREVSLANENKVHHSLNTLSLVEIMYRDIVEDGKLDGYGIDPDSLEVIELVFGQEALGDMFYQVKLSRAILKTKLFNDLHNEDNREALKTFIYSLANSDISHFDKTSENVLVANQPDVYLEDSDKDYYRGRIELPVSISNILKLKLASVALDDVLIENAIDDQATKVQLNTQDFSDGEHSLKITIQDEFDQYGDVEVQLVFDNTVPSIDVQSPLMTNRKQLRMQGQYVEGGSGIKQILVKDNVAILGEDGNWFVDVELESGKNELEIKVEDLVGNSQLVSKIAYFDTKSPRIVSNNTHSEARFISPNGLYYVENLSDANQVPLYIEIDHLDLNGTEIQAENLDAANIPFFSFEIEDPIQDGAVTNSKDLKVKFQYEKNGKVEKPWADLSTAVTQFILPLTREILGDQWQKSKIGDEHVLRVSVMDEAGNETEKTFSFYNGFFVPEIAIKVLDESVNKDWDETPFVERTKIHNTSQAAVSYEIFNPTDYAFYIQLNDSAVHEIQQQVEVIKRENKVDLETTQEWRIGPVANSYASCPTFDNKWLYVDHVWNYTENNDFVKVSPDVIDPVTEYVTTDSPVPPMASAWRDLADFDDHLATFEDTLDGEKLSFQFDYLIDRTYPSRSQPVRVSNWQRSLENTKEIIDQCADVRNFQVREVYDYKSLIGFPRNLSTIETIENTFETDNFKVFDEDDSEINELNGWYRVPSNHRVEIVKHVKTTDLNIYDDQNVLSKESITDYESYKMDSSINWSIKQGFDANFTYNPPNMDFNKATIRSETYDFGVSMYRIVR